MKLNEFVNSKRESQNDFFARSYWVGSWLKPCVFVWDKPGIPNGTKPDEIWSLERARDYVNSLRDEE